ncbi:Oidioi.mRNA.OKI2018_I69.chr1.g3585.t1.cds [Oikopleura dioica]|uniref:Oidioi.mRNA.OKI2018_I69.chr1.g3585.t1.cds n=1 Tax=Oikopleura dioica TaxID=34765 RepID=A0ABN7T035_OIKDI|nr:Oidioi.mRNA.OKI2018_I69.chr1.g3585.t1.cds [Oikopleura dioica]
MQIDDLPIELQAKIIEFTVKEDQKELQKIAQTSSQWKTLTEEICFWQPIFEKTIRESSIIQEYVGEKVIQSWRDKSRRFSSPKRSAYLQTLKKEVKILEHFFVQKF